MQRFSPRLFAAGLAVGALGTAAVLAAGAYATPLILERTGLGRQSGQLGRNLRIHPASAVGAYFDEDVYSWRGTLQPFYVDDWHESLDVMIEVTSTHIRLNELSKRLDEVRRYL